MSTRFRGLEWNLDLKRDVTIRDGEMMVFVNGMEAGRHENAEQG